MRHQRPDNPVGWFSRRQQGILHARRVPRVLPTSWLAVPVLLHVFDASRVICARRGRGNPAAGQARNRFSLEPGGLGN